MFCPNSYIVLVKTFPVSWDKLNINVYCIYLECNVIKVSVGVPQVVRCAYTFVHIAYKYIHITLPLCI